MKRTAFLALALASAAFVALPACKSKGGAEAHHLLNVSYDPTREFYEEVNKAFAKKWAADGKGEVSIEQSHGGSGKQARAVIDGLEADVVTLALASDIDAIAKSKQLPEDWQSKLPQNSSPYTSTIVFVVRTGNPKGIKDWNDLIGDGVKVVTPNPKTSGGARWNYLAAWAWANKEYGGDQARILDYISNLFKHVPVLDAGARGSTNTFSKNKIGDVLIAWENEAFLTQKEFPGETEIVYPSLSILAEPPVAVVDENVKRNGNAELAKAYLEFLYTEEAQDIAGQNYYRPRNEKIAAKYSDKLKSIPLVTIDKDFGGWPKAQKEHFDDGGTFDKIYAGGK